MPSWAVVIALGPVDGFITSGRRSRDLWWGSTWVSVCTLRTADALVKLAAEHGATVELVVPTAKRIAELAPGTDAGRAAFGGRVSNFIEAEVNATSAEDVAALLAKAEVAARGFLRSQLTHAVDPERLSPKRRAALDEVLDSSPFERQAQAIEEGDFLEFYAAWTPCSEGYSAAVERAWKLLEGRKSARLFEPARWSEVGRAKSDLDPGRDSVLHTANTEDRRTDRGTSGRRHLARRLLGIRPDEELDALGFARRLAVFEPAPVLGRLPFPPLTRVALDPWLAKALQNPAAKQALDEVRQIIERAENERNELFYAWCTPSRDTEGINFPYDASIFLEGELPALEKELKLVAERLPASGELGALGAVRSDLDAARKHLRALVEPVARLHAELGVPPPYFALLMADGDGVGNRLRELERPARQAMVAALDDYGNTAEKVVRAHQGCAFFVGGDDLAAYLPVDQALPALTELAASFHKAQEKHNTSQPEEETRELLSLSAGLVIAHCKADLRAVRRRARHAMEEAKAARQQAGSRDGFVSLVELPRSGNERVVTRAHGEVARDLEQWCRGYRGDVLSPRSAHLLRDLALRFADDTPEGGNKGIELGRGRLEAQMLRSSKQEETRDAAPEVAKPTPRARLRERLGAMADWRAAEHLAAELAIAVRVERVAALRGKEETNAR